MSMLPDRPWDEWVERVILHVQHYLSYDGDLTAGGRQRKTRDLASVIKGRWGREVVIAQKARKAFEKDDGNGNLVIGLEVDPSARGDRAFGRATSRLVRPRDAIIYVGNEDAWPHFVENCKAFHVGVWWDGPFSWAKRLYNKRRTMGLARACRSMVCVDTNTINWLRCQGSEGLALCNKCVYVPNCADVDAIPTGDVDRPPHRPLQLIWARRYEYKRGPLLMLDMLCILKAKGFPVHATFCMAQGQATRATLQQEIVARGLEPETTVESHDLQSVLSRYAAADVAIVPTIWSEGTSYACVEALCAGLPVVTTPVGGLANLVFPEHTGFVVAPTPEAMAAAVMRFSDDNLWRRMRRNCLEMRPSLSFARWQTQILEWLKT